MKSPWLDIPLDAARRRFARRLPSLELHVGDLAQTEFGFAPVALVFAGLVFEYVEVAVVLQRVRAMLVEDGVLACVIQLPNATLSEVTPSRFGSLGALATAMHLVVPEQLQRLASSQGYQSIAAWNLSVPGGKNFRAHTFER
jgi:hypothetical protein